MKPHVASAISLLKIVRNETDAIGVAVSFGKDSLCALELACAVFPRVEAYYLYRVRDMEIVAGWAADVKRRWGVTVRMYPHFDLVRCYRHAVMQPHWRGLDEVPRVKLPQIEAAFAAAAGIEWFAMGWRRSDSLSRALIMKSCGGLDAKSHRVYPLRAWKRSDVFEFLADRKIPLPDALGRKEQAGLDFHPAALCHLRDNFPADWDRWQRSFPFSGIQLVDHGIVGGEEAQLTLDAEGANRGDAADLPCVEAGSPV